MLHPTGRFSRVFERLLARAAALSIGAFALTAASPAWTPTNPAPAFTAACDRNATLSRYTDDVSVELAMRHFPWFHFHMDGTGQFVRGRDYVIRFTRMPFFAKHYDRIDLSPIAPSTWSKDYVVVDAQRQGDMTRFTLHERKRSPDDPNPLVAAVVTLDADNATRNVVMQYEHGSIQLALQPNDVQGYRLPVTGEAQIDMPGESLSAQFVLSNYSIVDSEALPQNPS